MDEIQPGVHCRICGSSKLCKYQYAFARDKVELYQILRRDGMLDKLIRPCECRGEFAHAHPVCLSDWLETTKHERCDICSFEYNIKYIERSIFDWVSETQQAQILLRVLGFATLIYYLCALGALVGNNKVEKNVLDVFVQRSSYIWSAICSLFLIVYSYKSINEFRHWKLMNRRVIVEENKSPQLDVGPKPKDILKSSGFKPRDNTAVN